MLLPKDINNINVDSDDFMKMDKFVHPVNEEPNLYEGKRGIYDQHIEDELLDDTDEYLYDEW